MKSDLARLMERDNIDGLLILGSAKHNPVMTYFTGNVHLGFANLIIKKGEEPVLFCNPMEREEAESTGLATVNISKYNYPKMLEDAGGDSNQANAALNKEILEDLDLTKGRLSICGMVELSKQLGSLLLLNELLPDLEIIGEGGRSVLLEARATKDEEEIDRIRKMGQITVDVVSKVADFLQNNKVNHDEILLNEQGQTLTIGDVKKKINLWLAEAGVENPKGTVFAIGRDAGIPHNTGKNDDQICLGKTIVFDIFPREPGGGYFFDFTRTWCLGYAPEAETKLHQNVKFVYDKIMAELKADSLCYDYQIRTCELFEELGHKTIRQDHQLENGYVHSLGHGLGLDVQERPLFGYGSSEKDILIPGSVVTIEPGLYYPDQGMGCRIEDTVWVRPDGKMEILAQYPYDLVLPMKYWKG